MANEITIKELLKKVGWCMTKTSTDYDGKQYTYTTKPYGNCYRSEGNMSSLIPYIEGGLKGEVIAYNVNPIGLIFMFKGERKTFSYIILREQFSLGGHNYKVSRLKNERFFEFTKSHDLTILNKEMLDKEKIKMVEAKL